MHIHTYMSTLACLRRPEAQLQRGQGGGTSRLGAQPAVPAGLSEVEQHLTGLREERIGIRIDRQGRVNNGISLSLVRLILESVDTGHVVDTSFKSVRLRNLTIWHNLYVKV